VFFRIGGMIGSPGRQPTGHSSPDNSNAGAGLFKWTVICVPLSFAA